MHLFLRYIAAVADTATLNSAQNKLIMCLMKKVWKISLLQIALDYLWNRAQNQHFNNIQLGAWKGDSEWFLLPLTIE
jgi:hypothetical protein